MQTHTFYWHDYETFGIDPRRDRPAQFAGIRTDAELNEIGEPLNIYCQPANDYLPAPSACLVTNITPQHCLQHGVAEHVFAAQIEAELAQPGTIGVGYNTIRFDDEFTRHLLWRNLREPYAREYKNNCGRWDLLDVVRLVYALRPEDIVWPRNPADGKASFKLGELARANGLLHEAAHDALSDVRATVALARLIRSKKPKLFDFCLGLHKKTRVLEELGLPATSAEARPFLHVSGMFAADRGCLALMWPLATHPVNKNEIIAWDLAHDPAELAVLNAETIRQRIFTAAADLPEGVTRLPIKTIHINKSPMVVGNLNTLTPAQAEKWAFDKSLCLQNAEKARALPDMNAIWNKVFVRASAASEDAVDTGIDLDVDAALYQGFVGDQDRRQMEELRSLSPAQLGRKTAFDDSRLPELVFRYRARNFPQTLSAEETQRWNAHRASRLLDGTEKARNLDAFFAEIDTIGATAVDEKSQETLAALFDYAESIAPDLVDSDGEMG